VTVKPVVPRRSVDRDIETAVDRYVAEAGEAVALDFIASLERAYRHVARHPASGSLRYAQELDLPGLRVWPVKRFPYLVFYVDRPDVVDVWRVLHAERDIPAWMRLSDTD
jgi:toxin ParE1/3/4